MRAHTARTAGQAVLPLHRRRASLCALGGERHGLLPLVQPFGLRLRVPLVRGGDLVYVPRIGDNTWKKALDEFRETTSLFSILALVRALGL